MQTYGVVRQTLDVDCVATEQGGLILAQALLSLGYRVCDRSAAFIRHRHDSPWLMDVDLLLVDTSTYDKLLLDSRPWRAGVSTWRVPSFPHLVAMKLHAIRQNPLRLGRDLSDIISLLQQNPGVLAKGDLLALCDRFGPPAIGERIVGLVSWNG
jgi:hypothetical protein